MDPISLALGLAQIAPPLLRYFGAGEKSAKVTEIAIDTAKYITGKRSPDDALTALQQSPELQLQYQEAIIASETKLAVAAFEDRVSARERDVEFIKQGVRNTRADILAYGSLAFLGLVMLGLFFLDIPDGSKEVLFMLVGALIAIVKDTYGFEFGSSRGSKEKDEERNKEHLRKEHF